MTRYYALVIDGSWVVYDEEALEVVSEWSTEQDAAGEAMLLNGYTDQEVIASLSLPGDQVDEREPGFVVVVENTPGYLPESEPADFAEYVDAVAYANELADELEEDGYTCDRSWASRDNFYAINCTRDGSHDLGRVIEVIRDEQ